MKKVCLIIALLGLVLASSFIFYGKKEPSDLRPVLLKGNTYQVEIADTPEKAEVGLMWRKSMPKNQGMLFVFPYPRMISMWMKNTYIPLDMIFFNARGEVICLRENTTPLDDENIITCPYPASKVLELNAGEIKAKKIELGDKLNYPSSF